jgi:serralysin
MVDISFLLSGRHWDNSTLHYTLSSSFLTGSDIRISHINSSISGKIDLPTIANGNSSLALAAMTAWSNVAAITFQPSSNPANADLAILKAVVIGAPVGLTASSVHISPEHLNRAAVFLEDNQSLWAYLHELGHALGLDHPGHTNPSLPASDPHYNTNTTIMSSNYGGRPAITPMIYDIAAIQSIYGANTSHNSGNTTYRFSGNYTAETIWDSGNNDTLDASQNLVDGSARTSPVTLDLREGFDANGKQYSSKVGSQVLFLAFNANIENAVGGSGGDSIQGNGLANKLTGGAGNDSLKGDAGNDELRGGKDNDTLIGGAGADKFIINNGDGLDTIYYGQQNDRIVFNGTTLQGTATYTGNGEYSLLGYKLSQHGFSLEITSPDGKTNMEAYQFFTTSNGVWFDTTNIGITVPGIYKSTGTPKTFTGTEKDDFFNLVGGPNIVNALGGNDTIHGASTVDGGAGNDYIRGTGATDVLNGGIGDDVILSNGGLDTIHGGSGNDRIYSGGGEQKIFGDAGFDIVDYASSQAGVEINLALTTRQEGWTYNYAYGDILSGIEGISGTGWGDTLIGDSGNNLLIGRGGADTLTGGAGADVFKYNHPTSSGGDIGISTINRDIITDFANGVDKIDLSDFAGTFAFRGTGAFTGTAHEVNYAKVAGNTMIGLDIDGNKTLDAQIQLLGLHTMIPSDFVV